MGKSKEVYIPTYVNEVVFNKTRAFIYVFHFLRYSNCHAERTPFNTAFLKILQEFLTTYGRYTYFKYNLINSRQ